MLKNTLQADLKTAMKNKDNVKKGCLQLLINDLNIAEKEKKAPLTEQEEFGIVYKQLKQTREPLGDFEKAGRQDLVDECKAKISLLESYVPAQLSETEILAEVKKLAAENNIENPTMKQKGALMKVVAPALKGKADGKLVSKVVDDYLKSNS